jgi:ADP-ribose pyrophosphatase YjhB (NUDIX family)
MINCQFEDGAKTSLRHVTTDTIVIKGDQVLLVKRHEKLIEGGKWCLPGGFMERDETISEGAAREVYEETGWTVSGQTLLTIIDESNWTSDDRQNVDFVFFAQAAELTGTPDWESDEVKWFNFDDLPVSKEVAFDHDKVVELYMKYKHDNLDLPIFAK